MNIVGSDGVEGTDVRGICGAYDSPLFEQAARAMWAASQGYNVLVRAEPGTPLAAFLDLAHGSTPRAAVIDDISTPEGADHARSALSLGRRLVAGIRLLSTDPLTRGLPQDLLHDFDVKVCVPPIRERLRDLNVLIPSIVLAVLGEAAADYPVDGLVHEARQYHWPGNEDQLETAIRTILGGLGSEPDRDNRESWLQSESPNICDGSTQTSSPSRRRKVHPSGTLSRPPKRDGPGSAEIASTSAARCDTTSSLAERPSLAPIDSVTTPPPTR